MTRIGAKQAIIAGVFFLTVGPAQAWAQTCAPGSQRSSTQINSLVSGNYACLYVSGFSGALQNNELNAAGGSLSEYGGGGTGAPFAVGTWSISPPPLNNSVGTITYTYGGGASYSYLVDTASQFQSGHVFYYFCQTSPGTTIYNVAVGPSHC